VDDMYIISVDLFHGEYNMYFKFAFCLTSPLHVYGGCCNVMSKYLGIENPFGKYLITGKVWPHRIGDAILCVKDAEFNTIVFYKTIDFIVNMKQLNQYIRYHCLMHHCLKSLLLQGYYTNVLFVWY
jgi:hypothetical protein